MIFTWSGRQQQSYRSHRDKQLRLWLFLHLSSYEQLKNKFQKYENCKQNFGTILDFKWKKWSTTKLCISWKSTILVLVIYSSDFIQKDSTILNLKIQELQKEFWDHKSFQMEKWSTTKLLISLGSTTFHLIIFPSEFT
jgi:hypothetical protein